jgi:uncharacterized protein (TIGR03000 family)
MAVDLQAAPPGSYYSGVYVGGYPGNPNGGDAGVYIGGLPGGYRPGYTGVYIGGRPIYGYEPLPLVNYARYLEESHSAAIQVHLPADAEVWFEGRKMEQSGNWRTFFSPALERGVDYTYHIKARWTQNGRQVERKRTVTVHAGDRIHIDLLAKKSKPV